MKYLISILFLVTALSINAQSVTFDTLNGNETVVFDAMRGADQIQALCTNIGGTSDGTLILKASVDNITYVTITETAGLITCFPNDTLTITDGVGWVVDIKDNPFNYYKIVGAGTVNDTTLVTIKWNK